MDIKKNHLEKKYLEKNHLEKKSSRKKIISKKKSSRKKSSRKKSSRKKNHLEKNHLEKNHLKKIIPGFRARSAQRSLQPCPNQRTGFRARNAQLPWLGEPIAAQSLGCRLATPLIRGMLRPAIRDRMSVVDRPFFVAKRVYSCCRNSSDRARATNEFLTIFLYIISGARCADVQA